MAHDWMMFYYANPQPARFVAEVRNLTMPGNLENPERIPVLAAFLSHVMAANASSIPMWLAELDDLRGDARQILHLAAWLSDTPEGKAYIEKERIDPSFSSPAPDLLARPVDHPAFLDVCWAIYFATGNPRAVRRVITALEYLTETGAADRFQTTAQTEEDRQRALKDALFQAASWSLGSLMQQHPPLQALCENILMTARDLTPNERVGLAITLEKIAPTKWRVVIDPAKATAEIQQLS